jgi:hypothetical protein
VGLNPKERSAKNANLHCVEVCKAY